jgi:nucleotide-binding universal stress UspA family protein
MISGAPTTPTATAVYLVAIDDTPSAAHVLEVACGLGAALGGAAELHVLHVIPDIPSYAPLMTPAALLPPANMLELGKVVVDRGTTGAAERFRGKIVGHLGAGDPWRAITQLASNIGADLLVVGTAGRTGIARAALGSVAEKVVRHAGCPVLVVRPKDYHAVAGEGIEPPCPDCVRVQKESARAKLWCDRHTAHHPHGRLHYELPPSFALGSMNFRP